MEGKVVGVAVSVPKSLGVPKQWALSAKNHPLFEWDGHAVIQVETEHRRAFYLGVGNPSILKSLDFSYIEGERLHTEWPEPQARSVAGRRMCTGKLLRYEIANVLRHNGGFVTLAASYWPHS
jgi:hypothetical protein